MPPKKAQQQNPNPYLPCFVLPLFLTNTSQQSQSQLILKSKPINIKKSFDRKKLIQMLKQKGLNQYIDPQQNITQQGRQYVCNNIKTLIQQFINQVNKPVDPKKDAGKKDTKKDTKNQQPVSQQNKQPTIQLNVSKKCNDFYFYLEIIQNIEEFKLCIQNGMKIDIVVIIQQKTKPGSKLPDYNLLNKNIQTVDLLQNLNTTKLSLEQKKSKSQASKSKQSKQIIKCIRKLQNYNSQFSSIIVTQIPYLKDLSHPQNNQWDFINRTFNNLGEITLQRQNYQKWIKNQVKRVPLIQPLKQVIKKQVPIQNQDKKGKKDAAKQPQFQTVEQVIQTKYQSLPQNIKSNLNTYHNLSDLKKNTQPQTKSLLKTILINCVQSVNLQLNQKNKKSSLQQQTYFLHTIEEKTQYQPLVKTNNPQTLRHNLRKIQKYSKQQLSYDFLAQQKQIEQNVTLQQVLHQDPKRKQLLQFQYLIKTITNFISKQDAKLKWNFQDRLYREKLNRKQIMSEIQKYLLKDPKVYHGILRNDNIKLICLAMLNPPGRVLYNNYLFQSKAVPNFQNWYTNKLNFSSNNQNTTKNQYYDYKFQDVGNLSIKTQRLTPTDNVIIYDQKITFGNQQFKINHFQKDNTIYGIRKAEQNNHQFWLRNENKNISLSILEKYHTFKVSSQIGQIQGSQNMPTNQQTLQNEIKQKKIEVWSRTQTYILSNSPYPTIIWQYSNNSNRSDQIRRQIGPKGQITSYLRDGSVKIFYLNGNISSYRNNRWERIINNQIVSQIASNQKMHMKQFTQGDKIIKIRSDQTAFIQYSNGNTLIIFADSTKVLFKKKSNTYQIFNFNKKLKQEIIVRITQSRDKNMNIIGHGSAFAYLGLNSLNERSYDGFIYQVWTNQLSSHLYIEKYQYQNKIYQQQIRLLYLSDGTFIKVSGTGHITYIQGDDQSSSQKLRDKWNQAFTLEDLHEAGVYDVNLNQGWIKTKDSESNVFKINVQEKNDISIAVSFKIGDEDQMNNQYGNGFHVPSQNYFLPSPHNIIPPRLFTFDQQTETYYEYLTQSQIKSMQYANSSYHIDQKNLQSKQIKLYTKKINKKQYFDGQSKQQISFSSAPSKTEYQIPSALLSKQTNINMRIQNEDIQLRIIQKIDWDKEFKNVNNLERVYLEHKQQRQKAISTFS